MLYNDSLILYMKSEVFKNQNFVISPLALKASIGALAEGVKGEAREELLHCIDYSSIEESRDWYNRKKNAIKEFKKDFRKKNKENLQNQIYVYCWMKNKKPNEVDGKEMVDIAKKAEINWAYHIINSMWLNADKYKGFEEDYKGIVKTNYNCDTKIDKSGKLKDSVNYWLSRKTNEYIKDLNFDIDSISALMINSLYITTAWCKPFEEDNSRRMFTNANNLIRNKFFMHTTGIYNYYGNENIDIVEVPLYGGLRTIYVKGEDSNIVTISDIRRVMTEMKPTRIDFSVPKFELKNIIKNEVFLDYLRYRNCEKIFEKDTDFSGIIRGKTFNLDDIYQIINVKLDEKGLDANNASVSLDKQKAEVFTERPLSIVFDKMFTFYILDNISNGVLYFGQIAE